MFATKTKEDPMPAFESVFDGIQRRLGAITEKNLISSDEGAGGGTAFGVLPVEQRKMWTLMTQLKQEVRPLLDEHNILANMVQREFGRSSEASRIVTAAQKPEVQSAVKRMDELKATVQPLMSTHKIVKNMFWNDVRTMFDAWGDQLWIDPDWTVRKRKQEDEVGLSLGDILGGLIGRG
jgi:hypothetical protein